MSFKNNRSGVEFDTEKLTPICNTTKQFGNRITISIILFLENYNLNDCSHLLTNN